MAPDEGDSLVEDRTLQLLRSTLVKNGQPVM